MVFYVFGDELVTLLAREVSDGFDDSARVFIVCDVFDERSVDLYVIYVER